MGYAKLTWHCCISDITWHPVQSSHIFLPNNTGADLVVVVVDLSGHEKASVSESQQTLSTILLFCHFVLVNMASVWVASFIDPSYYSSLSHPVVFV